MMFNDVYIETCSLASYTKKSLLGQNVTLWTRPLSEMNKDIIGSLYYDVKLKFNDINSDIHIFALNYFNEVELDSILRKVGDKDLVFYYQNQKYHETHEQKDIELQTQIEKYSSVIRKYRGFSWWSYIRHFIINT